MSAKVHPELLQQLDQPDRLVQAVLQLQMQQDAEAMASPEDVEKLARDVLQRASVEAGHSAGRTNILRNLGTIIVEATPDFVRSLINQPEVVTARPNQMTEEVFIPPKGRRPA